MIYPVRRGRGFLPNCPRVQPSKARGTASSTAPPSSPAPTPPKANAGSTAAARLRATRRSTTMTSSCSGLLPTSRSARTSAGLRSLTWPARAGLEMEVLASGLNLSEARALEQAGMAYYHTINRMNNQINGISPRYWKVFALGTLDYGWNQMTNEILYWTGN